MAEPALLARGLSRAFGGLRAVANVTLKVAPGTIHAVIGPNGAGKTTLINLLSGDLRPDAGVIHLGGRDVTRLRPDRRGRLGLGRSYQKTTIFPGATAFENARLAAQARSPRALSPWHDAARDPEIADRADAVLRDVGLAGRGAVQAGRLSHGEQRQLEIAMVLATEPSVILLDEPLAGMGGAEAASIIRLVAELKRGRAVLLVEHDMDAVFALADVLTVMADGQVIAQGAPADVRAEAAVRQAYLGAAAT